MPGANTGAQPNPDLRATALSVTCPHCGHPFVVVPSSSASPPPPRPPAPPPLIYAGRMIVTRLMFHGTPRPDAGAAPPDPPPAPAPAPPFSTGQRWLRLWVVLMLLTVGGALIMWRRPAAPPGPPQGSAPPLTVTAQWSATADPEAAIRETLIGYNAAETAAAARLRIDPLTPYLAPEGPFAARRAAELAARQRRNAPHRAILVRWGIGTISVNGDTATAITQETWSNQEAGAVAADYATVRVTYTLRWDAAAGRWLIVETSQMLL